MQVSLVADFEPVIVSFLALRLCAAMLLRHASGIHSLHARTNVTIGWLLSQMGVVDQIPVSGQIKELQAQVCVLCLAMPI